MSVLSFDWKYVLVTLNYEMLNNVWITITFLLCLIIRSWQLGNQVTRNAISVRGNAQSQKLPVGHTKFWDVYTYDFNTLSLVENENSEDGWVYPTSFDTLYLPSDLPRPILQPALGVVVVHGTARYIMPSIITTLKTADRTWRNRGICSLPRSFAWIDLFAPFTPQLSDLKYSMFEKINRDVRFLEDQDGTAAWQSLIDNERNVPVGLFRSTDDDDDRYCLNIESTLKQFITELASNLALNVLRDEGFRIVDIPLPCPGQSSFVPRGQRIKAFITDFIEPQRLLELDDATMIDNEPCGELDINLMRVGEGKSSKFLPQVYKELYEEGAILFP